MAWQFHQFFFTIWIPHINVKFKSNRKYKLVLFAVCKITNSFFMASQFFDRLKIFYLICLFSSFNNLFSYLWVFYLSILIRVFFIFFFDIVSFDFFHLIFFQLFSFLFLLGLVTFQIFHHITHNLFNIIITNFV